MGTRRAGRLLPPFVLALLALPAGAQEASRGEAPTPDSVEKLDGAMQQAFERPPGVRGWFPRLNAMVQNLPPFLRDTEILFRGRTMLWEDWRLDGSRGEAWAIGGSLEYHSGWLFEALRIGAAIYTSQPIYAPAGKGGTGLLRPGQQGYTVPGQAYLEMQYGADQTLKLYRQIVELPYVNRNDTRMTPNTFEAYLVRGRVEEVKQLGEVDYVAGYITKIRRRDQDEFLPMGKAAGVPGGDQGLATATLRWKPRENWSFGVTNHLVPDAFNTFYGEGSYFKALQGGWGLRVDGQWTWQFSVGDEKIRDPDDPMDAAFGEFDTWNVALRGAASYQGAILTLGGSLTSDDARIKTPYGLSPGYLGLMLSDFDRPGEAALLLGISYDFKHVGLPGFSGFVNFASGFEARSVSGSEAQFSDQQEVDLTLDYRPDEGWWRGVWLRARGAWRHQQGTERDQYQIRVILNYDTPIL